MMNERDNYRSNYGAFAGDSDGFSQWWQNQTMTKRLIIVNVGIFVLYNVLRIPILAEYGCLFPDATVITNPWRLFTCQFIHADFIHLLFNMYALWLFGRLTEHVLGPKLQLLLYLISGAIGGLLWVFCNWGGHSYLIGASGAIYGIMTAAALAYPTAKFLLIFPPIPIRLWVLVVIYCGYEILQIGGIDNIAHLAHLGGALGGLIFMKRLGFRL